jgi:hypothetical protein
MSVVTVRFRQMNSGGPPSQRIVILSKAAFLNWLSRELEVPRVHLTDRRTLSAELGVDHLRLFQMATAMSLLTGCEFRPDLDLLQLSVEGAYREYVRSCMAGTL